MTTKKTEAKTLPRPDRRPRCPCGRLPPVRESNADRYGQRPPLVETGAVMACADGGAIVDVELGDYSGEVTLAPGRGGRLRLTDLGDLLDAVTASDRPRALRSAIERAAVAAAESEGS